MWKKPPDVAIGKTTMLIMRGMWLVAMTIPTANVLISVGKISPFMMCNTGMRPSEMQTGGIIEITRKLQDRLVFNSLSETRGSRW